MLKKKSKKKMGKEHQTFNHFNSLVLQTLLELTSVTHLSCDLGSAERKDAPAFRN